MYLTNVYSKSVELLFAFFSYQIVLLQVKTIYVELNLFTIVLEF